MPKTGREMLKLLAKHGWIVVRIKGSHHILRKAGIAHKVVVPVHAKDTLKPGTENSILKQAGLKGEKS